MSGLPSEETTVRDELLDEVVQRWGTPTYVYDLAVIRHQAELLRASLAGAELHYAVKANSNGAVLRQLARLGFGAEVITLGELERAVRAGIPPDRVLLGGPGQDEALIERATQLNVGMASLDSASQWRLWRERRGPLTRFLVRMNPQLDPETHAHLATGAATSKFGLDPQRALELAAELASEKALAGFHFHIGSQIRTLEGYRQLETLTQRAFSAHPQADVLDLGGGFAVPDFPLEDFGTMARAMAERQGVRLLIEPGRFLVAEAGVLLTRVRHVKPGPTRHVIADAGMAELLRPALYQATHPVRRLGEAAAGKPADLDGPLCENADRLAQDARLPADVASGDVLVLEQAGAYGMAMSSNYASSLRPAEVILDGSEIRLARVRETVEDLLRLEVE